MPFVVQSTDEVKQTQTSVRCECMSCPLFYTNTLLGDDGCNDSISVLSPLPPVPSVQRIRSMPTSVTREQSSRRRALKVPSSQAQTVSVRGLQPKRVVL